MMENPTLNNKGLEKENQEKMQKRMEELLPDKSELPAPMSIQQVEGLKARIRELEGKLTTLTESVSPAVPAVVETHPQAKELRPTVEEVQLPTSQPEDNDKPATGLWKRLLGFLRPPVLGDFTKDRIASLENIILWALTISTASQLLSSLNLSSLILIISILAGLGFIFFFLRRGYIDLVGWLIVALMLVVSSMVYFLIGFTTFTPIISIFVMVLASFLIRRPSAALAANIIAVLLFGVLAYLNLPANEVFSSVTTIVLLALTLSLAAYQTSNSFHQIETITNDLRHTNVNLKVKTTSLQDRTRELSLAADVVQDITKQVGNASKMLASAVELIRKNFDLYYVQIYLVDPSARTIVLRAGTGDVGSQLLARGHRLLISSNSSNGRAVVEKHPVLISDTSRSNTFLPNPFLPNTRSEMVVPLIIADKVIGTLDMQSEKSNALNEENMLAFEALAGQIAVAVQNASLFDESERARREVEENVKSLRETGWRDFMDAIERRDKVGYVYNAAGIVSIQEAGTNPKLEDVLNVSIEVGGAKVGSIQATTEERRLEERETDILKATAAQLAHHIDNLRLLAQSQKYRHEAEEIARRLTREGWQEFIESRTELGQGFVYDNNKISTLDGGEQDDISSVKLLEPISIRNEMIGELEVETSDQPSEAAKELVATLASQLSGHIENLRLVEESEKRRIEAEALLNNLQESEARYSAVLGQATDGAVLIQDNLVKYVNVAMANMLGYTPSEMENQPVTDFIAPERRALVVSRIQARVTEEDIPSFYETRLLRKDGTIVEVELSAGVIDYLGRPADFGFARDITERKKAQNVIARRAVELATVANVSTTASKVLDPEKLLQAVVDLTKESFDIYHAHIYIADETFKNLVLESGAGEVGRKMVSTGHSIHTDAEVSLVARAAREQRAIIVNDVRSETGFLPNPMLPETRSEMALPMIVGDTVLGVFDVQSAVVNSFTEEEANIYTTLASQVAVALQNARLFAEINATAERLREVDRMKSEFLANMSHELRTPLNSLIGYAEILLTGLDGDLEDEQRVDIQAIYDNSKHLLTLINDVLDLAKIEAGRLVLKKEVVNISELIESVKNNNFGMIHTLKKPVDLVIYIESDLPELFVDPVRISQVLNNLVSNAIKFSEKGTISISARCESDWLSIEVKDQGIGIAQEDIGKIFERFSQVDGSTTRRVEGTGLGLPITYHLVEMHGGSLSVVSEVGAGSTFSVRLPVSKEVISV